MGERLVQQIDRVDRRQLRRTVVVSTAGTLIVIALYFVMPLDGRRGWSTVVVLALGLLAFAAVLALQLWQIMRADHPRLRAVQALSTSLPAFVVIFAATYVVMDSGDTQAFSERLTRIDALYFTITVFSTVGFGDITPTSQPARVVTMVQMVVDVILIGLVAKVLLGAVNAGLRRRQESENPDRLAP
jgi:voltage-gated potassium channel